MDRWYQLVLVLHVYQAQGQQFNFTHDHNGSYWHKKHDFLYLNKAPREHRVKLYNKLKDANVLDNSIYTFTC